MISKYATALMEQIPTPIKRALDAHAIISMTDRQGQIVYVNDLFCEISGYSAEELLGQNHRVLRSGEHSPEFYEDMWGTISRGEIWNGEVKNRKKSGDFYWVSSTIIPIEDSEGKISHYYSIRTDITETKHYAERSASLNKQLALVLKQSGTIIVRENLITNTHEVVAGSSVLPNKYKERRIDEFRTQIHTPAEIRALKYAQENPGKSVTVATRNLQSGKVFSWGQYGYSEAFEEQGTTYQLMYRVPVDELMRVQNTLEAALKFAQINLYEETDDLNSGKFLYNSGGRLNFLPMAQWLQQVLPPYRERVASALKNIGDPVEFEVSFNTDGSDPQWLVQATIEEYFDESGQRQRIGLSRNIHAEKTRILELDRKNQELSRLTDSNRRMFAVIGHELKTPLIGASMMLSDESYSDPQARAQIKDNIDHALSLIDQLREMIQPDQLVESKSLKNVDVCELVQGIIATQRATFSNQFEMGLRVGWLPERDLRINHVAVRQVLMNLIRNSAIHAKPDHIWVTLYSNELLGNQGTYNITVVVSDDGPGVPENKRDRLFDAFYQSDQSNQGTGIGLYVCRDAAQSMDGDLIYQDRSGGGAEFIFTFQAEKSKSSSKDIDTPLNKSKPLDGKRILFAEDTLTLQMVTEKILTKTGAKVSVASNGNEALNLFSKGEFDLVLTDFFMPELDGLNLTQELRHAGFTGPIIGLTAAVSDTESQALIEAGANGVLGKPLNVDKLIELLAQVVDTY